MPTRQLALIALLFALNTCAPAATPAAETGPGATAAPARTTQALPALAATPAMTVAVAIAQPSPTAQATDAPTGPAESMNAQGEYVLGSPAAPITLVDYSDFL